MIKNRLLYVAVVIGCTVFFVAYKEWFSWFVLMWVLAMPILSLAVSLPAMLAVTVRPMCPISLEIGTPAQLQVEAVCRLPAPGITGKYRVCNRLTGQTRKVKIGRKLPADHCGMLSLEPGVLWAWDYMGLFRLPVFRKHGSAVLVLPKPIAPEEPPVLRKRPVNLWRPKPGGGFSENHDLRLYRPGDNLRLIHWKLASKTKKLIYREPIEALRDKAVLSISLSGSPDVLDEKLGKLLWLSNYLLEKDMPHELRCATGKGMYSGPVGNPDSLHAALRHLLQQPAVEGTVAPDATDAYWHHHVGGGKHEA